MTYNNHKRFFNNQYRETDFFILSAFQDRISGRIDTGGGGGTGLTKLLQTLEEFSDNHMCYMVSKSRTLYFIHDLLNYDKDGWAAFNLQNNFHDLPPDNRVFKDSPIEIPGIAYNLCYVYKEK